MIILFSFSDTKVAVNVQGMAWPCGECYHPKQHTREDRVPFLKHHRSTDKGCLLSVHVSLCVSIKPMIPVPCKKGHISPFDLNTFSSPNIPSKYGRLFLVHVCHTCRSSTFCY